MVMRLIATLGALGVVLAMVSAAAAQSGVGITAPSPDRPERRQPRYERTYPNDAGYDGGGRGISYAPVFIGPTVEGQAGELGLSAWIAPNSPSGLAPGGGDVSGWAALGLTFRWGGPPRRPSAGPSVR
jgi:hypothetical protein